MYNKLYAKALCIVGLLMESEENIPAKKRKSPQLVVETNLCSRAEATAGSPR